MPRPLRKLLTRLILEAAITFEERSYRYYQSALERSIMSDSFDLLKKLLGEELRHRMNLEEAQRTGSPLGLPVEEESELSRGEIDAGLLSDEVVDELCDEWPEIRPEDSKQLILERALQREKCAFHFYQTMARAAPLEDLRRLFNMLREEEMRHISWIEAELKPNGKGGA